MQISTDGLTGSENLKSWVHDHLQRYIQVAAKMQIEICFNGKKSISYPLNIVYRSVEYCYAWAKRIQKGSHAASKVKMQTDVNSTRNTRDELS
jgi:hypothetical protein